MWLLNRYDKRHPIIVRDERVDEIQEEVEKLRKTQQILKSAVIELAYLRILDKYDRFVHRGFAHSNEKRVMQRIYDAYHLLGGNGTGSQMIEEILKLPSFPPDGADTDDE
ncbi:hypothetical protein BAAM0499_05950 [Bifidobacterium animalis subsp. animalis MCC 0499]|nr:hypothetical protein BAAM0499_05950 [Bifidobacterium animalis subsp. animalis MCC 0499]